MTATEEGENDDELTMVIYYPNGKKDRSNVDQENGISISSLEAGNDNYL